MRFIPRFASILLLPLVIGACGGGGGGAAPSPPPATPLSLELLAGVQGPAHGIDGPAAAATFGDLRGIASDSTGTVFVADGRTIRAIEPTGDVRTLAGNASFLGATDGPGQSATFSGAMGLARDSAGILYVADAYSHRIRRIDVSGNVSTIAGDGTEGSADGPAGVAQFKGPNGIALDADGNIFVADTGNGTIRRISRDGVVSTVAGAAGQMGSEDGPAGRARFSWPTGVAMDPDGNVVIADAANGRIRKLLRSGAVVTVAGGPGHPVRLKWPTGVAVDSAGVIYAAEYGNHVIRRVYPSGDVATHAGEEGMEGLGDGLGPSARFKSPMAIAFGSAGQLLVADSGNRRVRSVGSGMPTVTTIAGSDPIGMVDGVGPGARFGSVNALGIDGVGNLLVNDFGHVRSVTPSGRVLTLSGQLGYSFAVTHDASGNAIAARTIICGGRFMSNCTGGIDFFRITPAGVTSLVVHTASGWVVAALAMDQPGNLYLTQHDRHIIYKLAGAELSTFAGAAEAGFVDGPREQARFSSPSGITFDAAGHMYVADNGNQALRRISSAGQVTTMARIPGPEFTRLGLAVDTAGNVYVADTNAHVVRKVTPAGAVTVLIGTEGIFGSTTGALPGLLTRPTGVAIIGRDMYVATQDAILVVRNIQ